MKTTLKKRLLDALNACRAIQSFVENRNFAEYERNQMLRSAVERQFEIIGEALNLAEIESFMAMIAWTMNWCGKPFKPMFRRWQNASMSC